MSIQERLERYTTLRNEYWLSIVSGETPDPAALNEVINAAFEYGLATGKSMGEWDAMVRESRREAR